MVNFLWEMPKMNRIQNSLDPQRGNLFLGSVRAYKDHDYLASHHITHVLSIMWAKDLEKCLELPPGMSMTRSNPSPHGHFGSGHPLF